MKVGFIGLGIMGGRMAARILEEGHTLVVHNRTEAAARDLIKAGATWADSPAEVTRQVEVVVTMLADPDAVRSMALGEQGLLSGAREGLVWIDSSTVDPAFSREMSAAATEREVQFLDAPVAGSKEPARKGELLFLIGGPGVALQKCSQIFSAMGKKALHFGDAGKGSSMKMIVNLMLGQSMLAFTEAFALGRSMGLTSSQLFNTLAPTPVVAPLIGVLRQRLEDGDFDANFPLKHMHKDLVLAGKCAEEHGAAFESARVAEQIYGRAKDGGKGDDDFSAIFDYLVNGGGEGNGG